MKKKGLFDVEADLDPPGRTRPGAKAAEVAVKDSKLAPKRSKPGTTSRSRSDATGTRAGAATKRKRAR